MKGVNPAIVATLIAVSALSSAGCGGGAGESILRLGHDQTDGHPYDLAAERFARRVEQATDGELRIRIFPAAQLGDSPEQIEGLRMGTLDLALAAFSHASQFCPEFGLFGAPFLFEDTAHFAAVFDGEVGTILDRACREHYSIRLLATFTSGYRVLFNGTRPVETATDLEGLKIRVMGGEADALTWRAFGAIPVPMPYSEVYSALQAGVIDGAENEPASILANKFYEAAPYFAPTHHLVLPMGLFVSEATFQGLSEEHREVLRSQARSAAVWQRELMAERNGAALVEMRDSFGVRISDVEASELRDRALPLQDQVADRLGLADLLARVRAAAR